MMWTVFYCLSYELTSGYASFGSAVVPLVFWAAKFLPFIPPSYNSSLFYVLILPLDRGGHRVWLPLSPFFYSVRIPLLKTPQVVNTFPIIFQCSDPDSSGPLFLNPVSVSFRSTFSTALNVRLVDFSTCRPESWTADLQQFPRTFLFFFHRHIALWPHLAHFLVWLIRKMSCSMDWYCPFVFCFFFFFFHQQKARRFYNSDWAWALHFSGVWAKPFG